MLTNGPYVWSPRLIFHATCTILRSGSVPEASGAPTWAPESPKLAEQSGAGFILLSSPRSTQARLRLSDYGLAEARGRQSASRRGSADFFARFAVEALRAPIWSQFGGPEGRKCQGAPESLHGEPPLTPLPLAKSTMDSMTMCDSGAHLCHRVGLA